MIQIAQKTKITSRPRFTSVTTPDPSIPSQSRRGQGCLGVPGGILTREPVGSPEESRPSGRWACGRSLPAPCPLLQPRGSGRAGWFPLAFLPPRPAARPSPELCPWVWRRRREPQPGPGGGGAAEALIRSGAAGRQGSIQRADKRRVCGAEPAGTESSAGGPLARPQTQRRPGRSGPDPAARSSRAPHGPGQARPGAWRKRAGSSGPPGHLAAPAARRAPFHSSSAPECAN